MHCKNCGNKIIPGKWNKHRLRKFCNKKCSAIDRSKKREGMRKSISECAKKFWENVDVKTSEECWEWQGCMHGPNGYGWFTGGPARRRDFTHRISVWISTGEYPYGLVVRHKCDNKRCINPNHLLTGSMADNSRDAVERGLTVRGSSQRCAKLHEDQIKFIRSSSLMHIELARIYNVHPTTILRIKNGVTWKHV